MRLKRTELTKRGAALAEGLRDSAARSRGSAMSGTPDVRLGDFGGRPTSGLGRQRNADRGSLVWLQRGVLADAEHLTDERSVDLLMHCHTPDRVDYVVNGTQALCYPCGYAKNERNGNPRFDPTRMADVG